MDRRRFAVAPSDTPLLLAEDPGSPKLWNERGVCLPQSGRREEAAMAYEQAGDPKQALRYLRAIKETNDFRWALRRAPRLEQQLKTH